MLLPWKLIWLLRLPLMEKVALGGVFCVGLVCVIMAVVRTVSVGVEARSVNTPSSSWLVFWALIEAAIGESLGQSLRVKGEFDFNIRLAVVVGTLPSFAIFFRRRQHSRRYGSSGNGTGERVPTRSYRSGEQIYHPAQKIKLNSINITRTLEVSRCLLL